MRKPWKFDSERWDREHRWQRLGTYNAERARGIVHTPQYGAEMREQQAAFDAERKKLRERAG